MHAVIDEVKAWYILDSRGNPTVKACVVSGDCVGYGMAPSGASKGKNEAVEVRGGDGFHGKSVEKAVKNIRKIVAPAIKGMSALEQEEVDRKMIEIDGTKNKSLIGANAMIAVSMAVARCAAMHKKMELYEYMNEGAATLPIPFMNVINGGLHAGNELKIQEHMLAPVGAGSFREAVRMGSEVYHTLKEILKNKYGKEAINVGDEGGFAPPLDSSFSALELIMKAIEENGYENEVKLAIDSAASNFYDGKFYNIDGRKEAGELIDYYEEMVRTFPIISIEDPFDEEDWNAFAEFTAKFGSKLQIVGDDIYVTNPGRVKKGIKMKASNAVLIKPNQIGTITETMTTIEICRNAGLSMMISHRSGETCDDFISDLSVATEAGQIKAGAPARGERVAKYNRLMEIEDGLDKPLYYGRKWKMKGLS
ncbi:MAG: phosphopyruvate hydratase [Thermoplasmata archaeon]|nr:phosphopyruvate hydratase [Thermoplasmata archaeon]